MPLAMCATSRPIRSCTERSIAALRGNVYSMLTGPLVGLGRTTPSANSRVDGGAVGTAVGSAQPTPSAPIVPQVPPTSGESAWRWTSLDARLQKSGSTWRSEDPGAAPEPGPAALANQSLQPNTGAPGPV